jgi:hypothetical protein
MNQNRTKCLLLHSIIFKCTFKTAKEERTVIIIIERRMSSWSNGWMVDREKEMKNEGRKEGRKKLGKEGAKKSSDSQIHLRTILFYSLTVKSTNRYCLKTECSIYRGNERTTILKLGHNFR